MFQRAWWIGLATVILLLVAIGVWRVSRRSDSDSAPVARQSAADRARPDRVRSAARDEEFVGSAVCSECHAKIVSDYRAHPMGMSSATVAEASSVEDYQQRTSFDSARGIHFQVERTANGISHHEICQSGDDVLYDRAVDVQWAIGSGKRGRSYAFERNGQLLMSPISWYSQRGIWDLSPGYSDQMPNRFGRRVTDGCAACHIGRANRRPDAPDRFDHPVVLEAAIGCERCHGPAGGHVRWRQSLAPPDGPDPIVNPAKLATVERESVCNQCHLQGERRILRAGCTPFDFRPGQRLDEIWTVFVGSARGDASDQSTTAVSQVEQMRTSRCYLESSGRMGCISCHDPHSVAADNSRAAFYEQRCQSCHETRGCGLSVAERAKSSLGSACIDCHMPRLLASDIPHTSQTDHRILRDPKSTTHGRDQSQDSAVSIFDEETTQVSEVDRLRAKALWQLAEIQRKRDPEAARKLRQQLLQVLAEYPADPEILNGLGTLSILLNELPAAEKYFRTALTACPDDERTIEQLALFYVWRKNSAARTALEKSLAMNADNVEMWGRYARVLADAGAWPAALEAAEKGLSHDPSFAPLRSWLANAYRHRGDNENSRRHQRVLDRK
ncbi:MAG: tetratricopeptide repeat protein [Planctomycetaceae bacterium]